MFRIARVLAIIGAFGYVLALTLGAPVAFAHGDEDDYAAGELGDTSKPARLVEIVMGEGNGHMTYSPEEIAVGVGEQIKFVIKNAGALRHEFHLDSVAHNAHHKIEMEKHPGMIHDEPNAQSVEPGGQVEILWKFSKPGTFEYACLIPGHYDAGMHGKIVVK